MAACVAQQVRLGLTKLSRESLQEDQQVGILESVRTFLVPAIIR